MQEYRCGWPEIVRSEEDIAEMKSGFIYFPALPDEITRMEQTLLWITWVERSERRLIWQRAVRRPWRLICRELGCCRMTAWTQWQTSLAKIAFLLNTNGQKQVAKQS